jgi:hypothetical protein
VGQSVRGDTLGSKATTGFPESNFDFFAKRLFQVLEVMLHFQRKKQEFGIDSQKKGANRPLVHGVGFTGILSPDIRQQ